MPAETIRISIESPATAKILTLDCQRFLLELHQKFSVQRLTLLAARRERAKKISAGEIPKPLAQTASLRSSAWQVAATPKDLENRNVEITGPAERKMIINALNSEANLFMADFEDSLSPTWFNLIDGQDALLEAVRGTLTFTNEDGKQYRLKEKRATLKVRPRGWHLEEKHFEIAGQPISASLFDFGIFFFHNARELLKRGSGPYFYLPKLEGHLEARLWAEVFAFAENRLEIKPGSIRATVLIETCLAAFEMEEILFELKDYCAGLNAGRWDYIFSLIKKFANDPKFLFPDRAQVTMTTPFMKAYCELIVATCHKRGAHAIGGMSAFIPNRREPEVTSQAMLKVAADKEREARMGFDGTWVAHPDLIAIARQEFAKILESSPHQKFKTPEIDPANFERLLAIKIEGGTLSIEGMRNNIYVALVYIAKWLAGTGAVGILNLMEDAATAEISRSQLWQCLAHKARLESGEAATPELFLRLLQEEAKRVAGEEAVLPHALAAQILSDLVLAQEFPEFLTSNAYQSYFP